MSFFDEIQARMATAESKQREDWNEIIVLIKNRIREAADKLERSISVPDSFHGTFGMFLRKHPDFTGFTFEAGQDRDDSWILVKW